ncbi:MAG: M20/M25/M40 family metallo-hydrolase [Acidobacteria bacterium]|nr:M20/M25/M40 family metallo-hydrolase [Acidobacteriota bacterium]
MTFREQIDLTRALVDVDSTTGREGEAADLLARTLAGLGYTVFRQPVSHDRFNVIASLDEPEVVFSTHIDCVPPFFPSREEGGRVYGRGTADAKGAIAAQIAAAERLRAEGETRVGLVYVVGEERGSDGAKLANTIARPSRFLIDGEPTGNRLGKATRGVYRVRLRAHGRAAHSSLPELGESAIEKIVDAIAALRAIGWPADPELGATHYTVGLVQGGVAPNVVPPDAVAEAMFRTVGDWRPIRALLDRHLGALVDVEDVLVVPPVVLTTVAGFEPVVFAFTTDIPFLDRWGSPLLIGPGSIEQAHTDAESVEIAELERAVDLYAQLARTLLSQTG